MGGAVASVGAAAALGAMWSIGFGSWAGDDDVAFDWWLYAPLLFGALSGAWALGQRRGGPDGTAHGLALATVTAWAVGTFLAQVLVERTGVGAALGASLFLGLLALVTATGVVALLEAGRRRWREQRSGAA